MAYNPTYIGDGVYTSHDGYQIKLETLEGHVIYLDDSTYKALVAWNTQLAEWFKTHPHGERSE